MLAAHPARRRRKAALHSRSVSPLRLHTHTLSNLSSRPVPPCLATPQTKGTSSRGPKHNKSHTLCIRCGKRSFHVQKSTCAACGYPSARRRHYEWSVKGKRRKTTGTGRMAHLRSVHRRFRNGFREGALAKSQKRGVSAQ